MHPATPINRRRLLQAAGSLTASLALPAARAQASFLKGPARIIVPFPAGSVTDIVVRAQGDELAKVIGQPVLIDNKPGGTYVVAMQALAAAPADGHTLIHISTSTVAAQVALKRFDLLKHTAPISVAGETPMALLVNAKSPYKDLRELVDAARAKPGKVVYGSPGVGTGEDIKITQVEQSVGVKFLHVPYKGGPDIMKDLLIGDVDFTYLPAMIGVEYAAKGLVRYLAVMEPARLKEFPDAPALPESGLPITPLRHWGGYAARAGTSPALVQAWLAAMQKAIVAPGVANRLSQFGMVSYTSKTVEDFRKLIEGDIHWMSDIVKDMNLGLN